jgi:hypothetical protein
VYLLVFHAHINEINVSRSKIPSKKSRPYIYDVKFLALLGAPDIYDISRLRVNLLTEYIQKTDNLRTDLLLTDSLFTDKPARLILMTDRLTGSKLRIKG